MKRIYHCIVLRLLVLLPAIAAANERQEKAAETKEEKKAELILNR